MEAEMRLSLHVCQNNVLYWARAESWRDFLWLLVLVGKAHTHTVSRLGALAGSARGISLTAGPEVNLISGTRCPNKWLSPLAANLNHMESLKK